MTAPPQNARRFPNLPLTRPAPLAAMIEEATKAVVGQLIRLAPPNSATMLGRSVAVINTFIECSSTPPNKTQRVSTRCHARSARQLVSVVRGTRFGVLVDVPMQPFQIVEPLILAHQLHDCREQCVSSTGGVGVCDLHLVAKPRTRQISPAFGF